MTELIKNAWLGWKNYISDGKLPAVLLVVLLLFWFGQKKVEKKAFLLYTTIVTVFCILPFTAAALMAYQTRFYDYEWIWSIAPLTAVVSWGIVFFLMEILPDIKSAGWFQKVFLAVCMLAVLLLCGGPGDMLRNQKEQKADRQQALKALDMAREAYPGEDICLWAPREIMEYAREADASVRLPYGRDMWDAWLGAYSYDAYDEKKEEMFRWMESLCAFSEDAGDAVMDNAKVLEDGIAAGVNCILIPDTVAAETVRELEKALNANAQKLEGYWIFYGWTD